MLILVMLYTFRYILASEIMKSLLIDIYFYYLKYVLLMIYQRQTQTFYCFEYFI